MADPADRPGYSFDAGPPPEVSEFVRGKGLRDSFSWKDIEPEEHAVSFAVAKATKADVLGDVRDAIQKAIDEGQTLETFRKELKPILRAKGWWGRAVVEDPLTGEVDEVQLGSPRRLKTIFDANLRGARAAGQWERIQRTKKLLPFLEYRLGSSAEHRPAHAAKAGLILPVDDPFWDEWMPPNGWGCKCWVRQVTRAEAERRGVSAPPEVPDRVWQNERTGDRQIVPVGIDPGWQRNPGKLRLEAREAALCGKIAEMPADMQRAALHDIATSWRVRRMATDPKATGNVPVGIVPADIAAAAEVPDPIVQFSAVSRTHVFGEHPDRRVSDLARVADLDRAVEVLMQLPGPDRHPRLVFLLEGDPDARDAYARAPVILFAVFKPTGTFVDTLHRTDAERWARLARRKGMVILKRKR